ncbi:MAG: hypothetical protein RIS70_1580 [Planctomycetota bacterium]|jgi:hypothetical protein
MAHPRLKVFVGQSEPETSFPETLPLTRTVTLRLGDILPSLIDAVKRNRTWVRDFADDEITISTDLHEVLLAYDHFRRPSA